VGAALGQCQLAILELADSVLAAGVLAGLAGSPLLRHIGLQCISLTACRLDDNGTTLLAKALADIGEQLWHPAAPLGEDNSNASVLGGVAPLAKLAGKLGCNSLADSVPKCKGNGLACPRPVPRDISQYDLADSNNDLHRYVRLRSCLMQLTDCDQRPGSIPISMQPVASHQTAGV
jgi:hypothetical protein